MKFTKVDSLSQEQKVQIHHLWNKEYPSNISHASVNEFEQYLTGLSNPQYHLLLTPLDQIVGWFVDFKREEEIWFAMIIDADFQQQGLGTYFLHHAQERNDKLCGWVIDHANDKKGNGHAYPSPIKFYLKNGFELESGTRLEKDNISAVKIIWTNL